MWQNDSIINNAKLDETSKNTPQLHAKYLQLWSTAKLELRRAEFEQKKLLKDKWLYYNGKLSKEQIDSFKWEYDPFGGLNKPLKGDMNYYYDADLDIQKAQAMLEYDKVLIETLEEIMGTIRWRHQNIGNIIKWRSFEAGV